MIPDELSPALATAPMKLDGSGEHTKKTTVCPAAVNSTQALLLDLQMFTLTLNRPDVLDEGGSKLGALNNTKPSSSFQFLQELKNA